MKNKTETVLINSNFNCGYYIDRDKLYHKLRTKYGINCAYDPCSYPGIQSEFYYNSALAPELQTGKLPSNIASNNNITKVSFMIFRTGSVLIVGKCTEEILDQIYIFLKTLLKNEYYMIGTSNNSLLSDKEKALKQINSQRKIRRKLLIVTSDN